MIDYSKLKQLDEYAKSLGFKICRIDGELELNGELHFYTHCALNEPSEKFKENMDSNIHLSNERKKEFYEVLNKHNIDFMLDCKEHGFVPFPVSINFVTVHELEYLNKRDELRRLNNKDT